MDRQCVAIRSVEHGIRRRAGEEFIPVITVDTGDQEVGFNFAGQTVDSLRCTTGELVDVCDGETVVFRKSGQPFPNGLSSAIRYSPGILP